MYVYIWRSCCWPCKYGHTVDRVLAKIFSIAVMYICQHIVRGIFSYRFKLQKSWPTWKNCLYSWLLMSASQIKITWRWWAWKCVESSDQVTWEWGNNPCPSLPAVERHRACTCMYKRAGKSANVLGQVQLSHTYQQTHRDPSVNPSIPYKIITRKQKR